MVWVIHFCSCGAELNRWLGTLKLLGDDRSVQQDRSTLTHTHTPPNPICSRWYDHEWLKADYKPDSPPPSTVTWLPQTEILTKQRSLWLLTDRTLKQVSSDTDITCTTLSMLMLRYLKVSLVLWKVMASIVNILHLTDVMTKLPG